MEEFGIRQFCIKKKGGSGFTRKQPMIIGWRMGGLKMGRFSLDKGEQEEKPKGILLGLTGEDQGGSSCLRMGLSSPGRRKSRKQEVVPF